MTVDTVAIIPARGGSKGILRKNIRVLGGKPLLAYSIESARKACQVDRFFVSTDDPEIARVANGYDCEVIERPAGLADDATPLMPVVLHALDALKGKGIDPTYVILLQPTSPLRTAEDIDSALMLLKTTQAAAVVGVRQVEEHHHGRMYWLGKGQLFSLNPRMEARNRQDLPRVFHRNGALVALRVETFRRKRTFFPTPLYPYLMPDERSVDIDKPIDFEFAEFLLSRQVSARCADTTGSPLR